MVPKIDKWKLMHRESYLSVMVRHGPPYMTLLSGSSHCCVNL